MTRTVLPGMALVALALLAGACEGDRQPVPAVASVRTYTFRVEGPEADMPFYPALFHRVTVGGRWGPLGRSPVHPVRYFELQGAVGQRWEARTERAPSAAERLMLWQIDETGEFGDARDIVLQLPPRLRVQVTAPAGELGLDAVTFFHEETGTCGWALNDPRQALYEAAVNGTDRHAYQRVAQPRPFVCDGFRPGPYVVAGWVEGRQWIARRMDLTDEREVTLHTADRPEGGGTVVCENGDALLLIEGDLPVPCPHPRVDLAFRSTWRNVPPGDHAVRYPDGEEVAITVTDGEETRLPRSP